MTHICGICEMTKLHDIWLGGSQRLICIKPILSYNTFQNPFLKNLVYKDQDNPHTLHTDRYVVSGRNSTKFEVQEPPPLRAYGPEPSPDCC
jgi:hypothetical protein